MGRLDDMKRAVANKPPAAPKPPVKGPKPNGKPGAKPDKPAPPAVVRFKFTCGHEGVVNDLAGRPCLTCSAKNRRVKKARWQAKRASIQAEGRGGSDRNAGRLPDGSAFVVSYDAARLTWTGTLEVPGHPPFVASNSAVTKLLHRLDKLYRDSIKPPEPVESADAPDPARPDPAGDPPESYPA